MRVLKSFIDGEWIDSASGRTAPNINPANIDDVIGRSSLLQEKKRNGRLKRHTTHFVRGSKRRHPARGRIVAKAARTV